MIVAPFATQNRVREAFQRELHAAGRRARSKLHDPRAPRLEPCGFTREERLLRAECAQSVVEWIRGVYGRDWHSIDLDQWVERIWCMPYGLGAGAFTTPSIPLTVSDALGGVTSVTGYLQGELGVTVVTGVSAWASQIGGTTWDQAQGTAGNQPAYTANDSTLWGRSTVNGDGTDDFLAGAADPGVAPGTTPVFYRLVAVQRTGNAGGDSMISGQNASTICLRNGGANLIRGNNTTNSATVTMTVDTWYRVWALFNNSATVDEVVVGAGTSGTGTAMGNSNPTGSRFFGTSSGVANGAFGVQKALICNAKPTALQMAILDGIDQRFYNGNITL